MNFHSSKKMETAGYVTKTSLLQRGWTPKMIEDHLSECEETGHVGGYYACLYLRTRVDAIEPTLNLERVKRVKANRRQARRDKIEAMLINAGSDGSVLSETIARTRITIADFEKAVPVARLFLACNSFVKPWECVVIPLTNNYPGNKSGKDAQIIRGSIRIRCSISSGLNYGPGAIEFLCTDKGIQAKWWTETKPTWGQNTCNFQPDDVQKCFGVMIKAGFKLSAHDLAEAVRQVQEMEVKLA